MGSGSDEVEELRRQIDESRENLGASVGALAYKADIKHRGQEVISDKKEAVMEKVEELKAKVSGGVGDAANRIGDAAPAKQDVKQKTHAAAETARDNPLVVVAGATAAGLAAGLALPETELERQRLGPPAQDARRQVETKVKDTVQQVKASAQDAAQTAAQAVKEKGQQHGGKVGELAETAADRTQEKIA